MKLILIMLLMNGNVVTFEFYDHQSPYQCDAMFNKLTHQRTVKNYKGRNQIGTFFKNQEVLLYTCEKRKTI